MILSKHLENESSALLGESVFYNFLNIMSYIDIPLKVKLYLIF